MIQLPIASIVRPAASSRPAGSEITVGQMSAIRDAARFAVPGLSAGVVARTRLDHHYASAVGRILRVMAPAGYGKSTLVSRWVGDEVRAVRWLDLEPIDNDPIVLMSAIANGISDLVVDPSVLVPEYSPYDRRFVNVAIPAFGAAIRRIEQPFVVVIDDTHHLTDPTAWRLIDSVARNIPSSSTLVLVGRGAAHTSALAMLRLEPGIVDLATADLALDVAETEELLAAHGVQLDDITSLSALADRFEGWPAGLRLASLVLATPNGAAMLESATTGKLPYVIDFLRAEWFDTLDADDRQFLMEVAVLGRFTAEMADTVLDRSGSAEVIHRLERHHRIVLPLDQRGEWYRMHAVLRDWLETELHQVDRPRWREVHLDSARWWEVAGDIDLAVHHLERVGADERRAALVMTHAGVYITRGLRPTARRWLSTFPPDYVRRSPALCALEAIEAAASGDGERALAWTKLLPSTPEMPDAAALSSEPWLIWPSITTAALVPSAAAEHLAMIEVAYRRVAPGAWRALACTTYGALLALVGDVRSLDVLAEGAHEAAIADAPNEEATCLVVAAIVTELRGDRARAAALTAAAAALVEQRHLETSPVPTTPVLAMAALGAARAGRHDLAAAHIRRSREQLAGFAPIAPWYNVLTRVALVNGCLLADDPVGAAAVLRELEQHLRFEPAAGRLRDDVEALRAGVDAAAAIYADRSWSLTNAELRVLQHLPTNLSLADIATRLFISRNTVKSHTSSIYRKLGTTSRSRTVDLAREAGLLTEPVP